MSYKIELDFPHDLNEHGITGTPPEYLIENQIPGTNDGLTFGELRTADNTHPVFGVAYRVFVSRHGKFEKIRLGLAHIVFPNGEAAPTFRDR